MVHDGGNRRPSRRGILSRLTRGPSVGVLLASLAVAMCTPVERGSRPEATAPLMTAARDGDPPNLGGACPDGMILVPGGPAPLGDDVVGLRYNPTNPSRTVDVAAFCIDVTEVTVKSYVMVMGPQTNAWCLFPETYPARCGTFDEAATYCRKLGRRLPTSDEWELAGRSRDARLNPWAANEPAEDLVDGHVHAHPVGADPRDRSPYGVMDLGSNAREWVDGRDCDPHTALVRGLSPRDPSDGSLLPQQCTRRDSPSFGFRCATFAARS